MVVNTVKNACTPQYIAIYENRTLEEIITQLHKFERIVFNSSYLPVDPLAFASKIIDHVLISLILT